VDQGPNAVSLRTFDEKVINPFLKDSQIPSSKGPYLAMFRRGYEFTREYKAKPKDPRANAAFLDCMDRLESMTKLTELQVFLQYMLYRFWQLREESTVTLTRIQRLSLNQYDKLISELLRVPSGGRLPVLFVQATFNTIKSFFGLDWEVECQGINVADAASGAGGDLTIKCKGEIVMAAEVTERMVDRARLTSTFRSKITPAGIADYLFLTKSASPDPEAQALVEQYFAQGHEINFLEIKNWIVTTLGTVGAKGRAIFIAELLKLLDRLDTPKAIKVAWNDQLAAIVS
jgi:hypothetical protein